MHKPLPSLIDSLKNYVIADVVSGNDHCLATTEDGFHLFSWGQGKFGALGTAKSQHVKRPQEIPLPNGVQVAQIAAGSRHSAFVTRHTRHLFMFGLALHGQLGLGDECTDRAFKPEMVPLPDNLHVGKIALGDSHSLLLTTHGRLYSTGANDKYQLGQSPEQRSLKVFSFQPVPQYKTGDRDGGRRLEADQIVFKDIACWNLNCAIDSSDRAYLWGILHDK